MGYKQQIIIGVLRQGKSQRAMAKELGISRTTVGTTLKKHKKEQALSDGKIPKEGIIISSKYDSSKRSKRRLTLEIREKIDKYLSQNKLKIQTGRKKQQLKGVDIDEALHAHACYFSFTGYVATQMVYDNMRVAVAKFAVKNKDKQPTEDLLKIATYYQFHYRFCNVRKGNEKGFVERSVEYVRRKGFALLDDFTSLDSANEHLFEKLLLLNEKPSKGQTESIQQRFDQETSSMLPSPVSPYDAGTFRRLRIDKYSCIKVDTNYYSVPEDYPSKTVEVKIYPAHIKIYSDNLMLTQHQRRHTRFQYYLHLAHYLKTLLHKPGALAGAKSLQQADSEFRQIFQLYFKEQASIFIQLLLFIRQHHLTVDQLIKAVQKCLRICPHQLPCPDKIKTFLIHPPQQQQTNPDSELSKQITLQAQQQLSAIQQLLNTTSY